MATWVLVADGSRARLFSVEKSGSPWTLVDEFEHEESRAKTMALDPSDRGRQKSGLGVATGVGVASRAAMEPKTPPRRVEQIHFAQQIKDHLSEALNRGEFSELVLVAPPKFLGRLKAMLDPTVAKTVARTIGKDYTKSEAVELRQRLNRVVFSEAQRG